MEIVERVLNMRTGYVLDFSDRKFDEFIAHEIGLDATAPRFSTDGGSKARRLRRILPSLGAADLGKLLSAFLRHRDSPARAGRMDALDDEWRVAYDAIVARLDGAADLDAAAESIRSSAWTGRRTVREQVAIVRSLAPMALAEVDALARLVEERRFNDELTAEAIACLRELHAQLGELIALADRRSLTREAVAGLEARRGQLLSLLGQGAKVTMVAPALTFGVMHLLAWISGVGIDSTMVTGVYGSILGADALAGLGKNTGLSKPKE